MKAENKGQKQLIILGVLVVLFVGFVSFQFMGSKKVSAPPAPPAKAETVKKLPADPDPQANQLVSVSVEYPNLEQAVPRRDPFRPLSIGTIKAAALDNNEISNAVKITKPNSLPTPNFSNIKPLPINPLSQEPGPSLTIVEKEQQFTLTGVIKGRKNIAILRSGEGSRIIAREGDMIDAKYKLLNVSQDSVILSSGNHVICIRLGGNNNAS